MHRSDLSLRTHSQDPLLKIMSGEMVPASHSPGPSVVLNGELSARNQTEYVSIFQRSMSVSILVAVATLTLIVGVIYICVQAMKEKSKQTRRARLFFLQFLSGGRGSSGTRTHMYISGGRKWPSFPSMHQQHSMVTVCERISPDWSHRVQLFSGIRCMIIICVLSAPRSNTLDLIHIRVRSLPAEHIKLLPLCGIQLFIAQNNCSIREASALVSFLLIIPLILPAAQFYSDCNHNQCNIWQTHASRTQIWSAMEFSSTEYSRHHPLFRVAGWKVVKFASCGCHSWISLSAWSEERAINQPCLHCIS